MIVEGTLGRLSHPQLVRARYLVRGLEMDADDHTLEGLSVGAVAATVSASIGRELAVREAGLGRDLPLHLETFEDFHPDRADAQRRAAMAAFVRLRNDQATAQPIRDLFATVAALLSEPSPTQRAAQVARFERL